MNRWVAAGGVLATCGGVAVVLTGVVGPFAFDYTFVTLVGLLALVQGVRYANGRRRGRFPAATTDDPELRWHAPVPGTEFESVLAGISGHPRPSVRDRVRERIRAAVVETVAATEGVTDDRAAELVEAGTWTPDPVAARFLGADVSVPYRSYLRASLRGESRFTYGARRADAALDALEGES